MEPTRQSVFGRFEVLRLTAAMTSDRAPLYCRGARFRPRRWFDASEDTGLSFGRLESTFGRRPAINREDSSIMLRSITGLLAVILVSASTRVPAGEFNAILNVGDPAPAWINLPGVDGKKHSLSDLSDKQLVVVVFTCNSCPVASDYEDRIIAFAKKYAAPNAKTAVVAINVNTVEEDRLPKMKERAESRGFPYPYLFDPTQRIAKAYGAIFTPEFFVLDKDRKIAYMGGFDDNSEPSKVKRHFLESAVEAVLKGGKPSPAETIASGCLIRYDRGRRRKPPVK
jgi:peroxiredoxin